PAQSHRRPKPRLAGPERERWKSSEEGIDRDLRLQTWERCTETKMDTPSEGQVWVLAPLEVQAIGVFEFIRSAVGGTEDRDHEGVESGRGRERPGFHARTLLDRYAEELADDHDMPPWSRCVFVRR